MPHRQRAPAISTFQPGGATIAANNAFFQDLGNAGTAFRPLTAVLALRVWAADLSLAPPAPDKPWPLPSTAEIAARASVFAYGPLRPRGDVMEQAESVAIDRGRRYSLAELIDLAQRINPETREAWEQARQAALAVGLVESSYAPQVSIEAIAHMNARGLAARLA